MANAIIERGGGVGVDCDDATATTAQVLTGYTFGGSASDEIQNGSMPNQGKQTYTINTNGGVYQIPQGYHNGSGKVTYTLPSDNGGKTFTPTAAAQTVNLSGKYLKANDTVLGSSNLTAGNIVKGKTIWGVAGSFVNIASVSRVYNGSSFSGFLSDGVVNAPTANGQQIHSYWGNLSGKSANAVITSGQIYGTSPTSFTSGYPFGMVSAKSIDFSLFSSIRITGYFKATVYVLFNDTAYASMRVTVNERTNNGSTTTVANTVYGFTNDFRYAGADYDGSTGSGTVNFDFTFDISSWTGKTSFLEILLAEATKSTGASITWRGMSIYVTNIYLS